MRLLDAELLKLRTAPRTLLALVLGLVALMSIAGGSTASSPEDLLIDLGLVEYDLLGIAAISTVFTLILGILIVTWEYRHGTITQTFLATPRRELVIGAKLAVSLVSGALLVALALVTIFGVALIWIDVDLDRGHWELIGRLLLAGALWGALGCGLGALLQTQVGAIVITFIWFLVAEPLLGHLFDSVADYLPGSALERLLDNQVTTNESGERPNFAYGLGAAALLVAAYTAGFAALGIASAVRRDVP